MLLKGVKCNALTENIIKGNTDEFHFHECIHSRADTSDMSLISTHVSGKSKILSCCILSLHKMKQTSNVK